MPVFPSASRRAGRLIIIVLIIILSVVSHYRLALIIRTKRRGSVPSLVATPYRKGRGFEALDLKSPLQLSAWLHVAFSCIRRNTCV